MINLQHALVKSTAILLVVLVVIFLVPINVAAQQGQPPVEVKCADGKTPVDGKCPLENPAPGYLVNTDNFGKLLSDIIQIFLAFAGAIAVIFLIVGGFQYVASRGNEEAMEKAKRSITAAIIGIVIIVMAFAIVAIVNNLLTQTPPG